jgi:DNA-binding response OmpR family regulator
MNKEKILIIEDDSNFGESVSSALKGQGYSVLLVNNGMNGLKSMYDISPDLILLDITLGDLDSYDLLAKKISDPLISKIPVFLVSSQGVPINMRKIPQDSVKEFILVMHTQTEEIVDKVNRYLGHEPITVHNTETKKLKVLWVEDDKLIGAILAKRLIASGFDLFHAKSGEEALESLKQAIPDVIVLDLLLPGINGFDVLKEINKDSVLSKVPTMILTNLSKPSDIERAQAFGVKKFMIKATASLEQIVKEIKALKD